MTAERLSKAARATAAARRLLHDGDADFAIGRAYYAMFYTAEALLATKGLRFGKHAGVHGAYGLHFAKAGILDAKYHGWMLEAFAARMVADYDFSATLEPDEVRRTIEQAGEFLEAARTYLGRS